MDVGVRQMATALHLFPTAQNQLLSLGSRQGEVTTVEDDGTTSRLYFDKITYAPFQEALYKGVGKATAALTLASIEAAPAHCATWIAGSPTEEALAVFKVFATNHANAAVFRSSLGHSGATARPRTLECTARGVYPWGCQDLLRSVEVTSARGADWAVYSRRSVPTAEAFEAILIAVLGFYEASYASSRPLPLLQLRLAAAPEGGPPSVHTLTLSPSVLTVCEAFAVGATSLRGALMKKGPSYWAAHPLLRYLAPSATHGLDRLVLVTCVGDATADTRAGAIAACRFAARRVTVIEGPRPAAEPAAAPPPALRSAERSHLAAPGVCGEDILPCATADAQLDALTDAILFGVVTPDKSTGLEAAATPSPAAPLGPHQPQSPPWTSATRLAPSDRRGAHTPAGGTVLWPNASARRRSGSVEGAATHPSPPPHKRLSHQEVASLRSPVVFPLSSAHGRVERGLWPRIHKKGSHTEGALLAAGGPTTPVRQQGLDRVAQSLARASAEVVRVGDGPGDGRRWSELSLWGPGEGSSAREATSQRTVEQSADLCQRYIAYSVETTALLSSSVTAHQDLFSMESASLHRAMLSRLQASEKARGELMRAADSATVGHLGRSLTDPESLQQRTHMNSDALVATAPELPVTRTSLHAAGASLRTQREVLREQVGNASVVTEDSVPATEVKAPWRVAVLVGEEAVARLAVHAEWERASCATLARAYTAMRATAARERVAHSEAEARAALTAEAFLSLSALVAQASSVEWIVGVNTAAHDTRVVAMAAALPGPRVSQAEIDAMQRVKDRLQSELDSAMEDVEAILHVKESLEQEVAGILERLAVAMREVMDSESLMLQESERSLSILQCAEAQSAAEYCALIDRCTALIEARSASHRSSVAPSTRGE